MVNKLKFLEILISFPINDSSVAKCCFELNMIFAYKQKNA